MNGFWQVWSAMVDGIVGTVCEALTDIFTVR